MPLEAGRVFAAGIPVQVSASAPVGAARFLSRLYAPGVNAPRVPVPGTSAERANRQAAQACAYPKYFVPRVWFLPIVLLRPGGLRALFAEWACRLLSDASESIRTIPVHECAAARADRQWIYDRGISQAQRFSWTNHNNESVAFCSGK